MLFMLNAAYIAGLAAYLTLGPQPQQPIRSIGDFAAIGTPACIRNVSGAIYFMARSPVPALLLGCNACGSSSALCQGPKSVMR